MTTQSTHDCSPSGHPWTLDDFSEPIPGDARLWNPDGVVILEDFMPHSLIDAYLDEWKIHNGYRGVRADGTLDADSLNGYTEDTPYLKYRALFDIVTYGPLGAKLEELIGEPAGCNLVLSGLVSTTRSLHVDAVLNEPGVDSSRYAAVWIATGPDQVRADAGPFQYVKGSAAWGSYTSKPRMGTVLDLRDPSWPAKSEQYLYPLYMAEIEKRDAELVTYLPNKGDVLIWSGFTLHQGSIPAIPNMYRGSLIAHYSGKRWDMPAPQQAPSGGYWIPFSPLAFDLEQM